MDMVRGRLCTVLMAARPSSYDIWALMSRVAIQRKFESPTVGKAGIGAGNISMVGRQPAPPRLAPI